MVPLGLAVRPRAHRRHRHRGPARLPRPSDPPWPRMRPAGPPPRDGRVLHRRDGGRVTATAVLREILAPGPVMAAVVLELMAEAGYSTRQTRTARQHLGVF